jgi:hypothetical protein
MLPWFNLFTAGTTHAQVTLSVSTSFKLQPQPPDVRHLPTFHTAYIQQEFFTFATRFPSAPTRAGVDFRGEEIQSE